MIGIYLAVLADRSLAIDGLTMDSLATDGLAIDGLTTDRLSNDRDALTLWAMAGISLRLAHLLCLLITVVGALRRGLDGACMPWVLAHLSHVCFHEDLFVCTLLGRSRGLEW